ncbi:hypothetical protein BDF19DRAFT_414221 [Syncephalis fuscata]|nr:hypothetical protein BDF19DRAFT_414221 [Syncephalis fuscata]
MEGADQARFNTQALYATLEVARDATDEEIRRSYRRLALRYHPDKNPGAADQFKAINHAYEVLSDRKKRSVYDRYGEFGLQMIGTPVGILFDPDYSALLCRCFFATSLLTGLLIIFCALLSVQVDGKSNWSWGVVFIPLWLLDAVLLFWLVPLAFKTSLTASGIDDDDDDDDDEPHPQQKPSETGSSHGTEHSAGTKRESKQERRERAARQRGIFVSAYLFLCFIFQLLIVLREDQRITWSAGAVFFPYWILEAINGFSNILATLAEIRTIPSVDPTTNAPWKDVNVIC